MRDRSLVCFLRKAVHLQLTKLFHYFSLRHNIAVLNHPCDKMRQLYMSLAALVSHSLGLH